MSNNDDFYTDIEHRDAFSGLFENPEFSSVRKLTDRGRSKAALRLPVDPGTRVTYAGEIGNVLFDGAPAPGSEGEVVLVRSSSLGDITAHNGHVFVKWNSGEFGAFPAEHLRRSNQKCASTHTMRVGGLGDLSGFIASGEHDLVHRATKDLWSFRKDGDDYVIQRLFDDNGDPLQV